MAPTSIGLKAGKDFLQTSDLVCAKAGRESVGIARRRQALHCGCARAAAAEARQLLSDIYI
jgi:hypothetical protein